MLSAYAQMPQINVNAELSSEVRCLNFGLILHLHPYFVYASSDDSGASVHMRRLT